MAEGGLVTPAYLGAACNDEQAARIKLNMDRKDAKRSALRECLDRSGHNVSPAARDPEVSRTTMYRLLDKHHMSP
jgi:transcriptional regulator of acetoin/glycerol metabolism